MRARIRSNLRMTGKYRATDGGKRSDTEHVICIDIDTPGPGFAFLGSLGRTALRSPDLDHSSR